MNGSVKPLVFSVSIHPLATYMTYIYIYIYLNEPGYKVCFGRKKMEARCEEILRKTKVVSRPPLTLVLVDLQTYFTRQNMSF